MLTKLAVHGLEIKKKKKVHIVMFLTLQLFATVITDL